MISYRTLLIKILSLAGVKFKFRNVYGAYMVFYKGFGAEYFMQKGEKGTLSFIRDNLGEGQVFVDVGAYVGFFSIFASKIVGKNGKVLAFEPNPQAHKILLENIKINRCDNISAFNIALGSREGFAFLDIPKGKSKSEATVLNVEKGVKVAVKPLDNILKGIDIKRVDMVKIDVEGWENEVLKGMKETLMKYRPILIVEKGPLFLLGYDYLMNLGYRPFRFKVNKNFPSQIVEVKDYDEVPLYDNIIFLPR